jgi:hypothetical protein
MRELRKSWKLLSDENYYQKRDKKEPGHGLKDNVRFESNNPSGGGK